MSKLEKKEIQLVIIAALEKEIPKKWLEENGCNVFHIKALESGILNRKDVLKKGFFTVISGVGERNIYRTANWIKENLSPLYILNIGTAGTTDQNLKIGEWIQLYRKNMHHPLWDSEIKYYEKDELIIDMESKALVEAFETEKTTIHIIKMISDYNDEEKEFSFQKALPVCQKGVKSILNWIEFSELQISVIIPVHNRSIEKTVSSVLAQTVKPYEIIVVDDGSIPEIEIPNASLPTLPIYKYRIEENLGVSHARNFGVEKSQGNWVAFLDSDDEWLPNKLEEQCRYLKHYPFYNILQSEEVWIRNGIRVNLKKHHKKPLGFAFQKSLERCLISPSSVMLKKDLFSRVGGFDETMEVCEDYDLWLRILWYTPIGLSEEENLIKYGGHTDQLSQKYQAMDLFRIYSLKKFKDYPDSSIYSQMLKKSVTTVLKKKERILKLGQKKRELKINYIPISNIRDLDSPYYLPAYSEETFSPNFEQLPLLLPLIVVKKEDDYFLVDGKKRLNYIKKTKQDLVPVLALPESEIWASILEIKKNQIQSSIVEKIGFLKMCLDINIPREIIQNKIILKLQLPAYVSVITDIKRMHKLPDPFLKWAHNKNISFKQLLNFAHYPVSVLERIFSWKSDFQLSVSLIQEVAEHMKDHMKHNQHSVEEVVEELNVEKICETFHSPGDRTQKLRQLIKEQRFPVLTQANREIEEKVQLINKKHGIQLDWDKTLENKVLKANISFSKNEDIDTTNLGADEELKADLKELLSKL